MAAIFISVLFFLLCLRLCFSFHLFVVKLNNNKEQRVESMNKSLASFSQTLFSSRFPLPAFSFFSFLRFLFLVQKIVFLYVFFSYFFFLVFGVAAINCFSKAFLFLLSAMLFVGRRLKTQRGRVGRVSRGGRVVNENFFLLLFFCICECLFYPFAIVLFHYNISHVFPSPRFFFWFSK